MNFYRSDKIGIAHFENKYPDLPLTPFGDFKVGMGLWNYDHQIAGKCHLFLRLLYLCKKHESHQRAGYLGLWIMTGFFLLANGYNLLGPPPEDNVMVLFVSFDVLQMIVLGLAWWVDRNREIK